MAQAQKDGKSEVANRIWPGYREAAQFGYMNTAIDI
jgi:hypothetical protein